MVATRLIYYILKVDRRSGEIGIHAGFRILCPKGVEVQLLSAAPRHVPLSGMP